MIVTREEFNAAAEALWGEIEYQNSLDRRTEEGEAKDPAAFATLGRVYLRRLEDTWADSTGNEETLPFLRKVAAIFVRAMIYNGVRYREALPPRNKVVF
jgi:hypothetical protein